MSDFLLLRPEHKCQPSQLAFKKAGLSVSTLALQRIQQDNSQLKQLSAGLASLPDDSIVIVVSPVAADLATKELNKRQWPASLQFFAVGQSSATPLRQQQLAVTVPDDERSEGLLALDELQRLEDQSVLIIKGQNGRQTLADTLKARGAEVNEICLYQRVSIPIQPPRIPWQEQGLKCIICSSSEQLKLAFESLPTAWLTGLPWVLVSQRTEETARALGITRIIQSTGASDQALIEAAKSISEQFMSDHSSQKDSGSATPGKSANSKAPTTQSPPETNTVKRPIQKASSSAWIKALLAVNFIAILALSAAAALAWQQWQITQPQLTLKSHLQQAESGLKNTLQRTEQTLKTQLQTTEQQLKNRLNETKAALTSTRKAMEKMSGRRSNDWALAEAEYLMRMAGRKLWLEQDQNTAIRLLQDADERLQHMSDPALIPVRTLVYQDIQTLKSINAVDTSALALKLLSLVQRVPELPLAMVQLPEIEQAEKTETLSHSSSDWKQNLRHSWQQFTQGFITVRKRQDAVRPMMTLQQQWLTRQQVQHFLLQSQGALLANDQALYQKWLEQAANTLLLDFDTSAPAVSQFISGLKQLQQQDISRQYPGEITALKPLQDILQYSSAVEAPVNGAAEGTQP